MSESLLVSELRRVTDEIRPFIEKAGFVDIFQDAKGISPDEYMKIFEENIRRLMRSIRTD